MANEVKHVQRAFEKQVVAQLDGETNLEFPGDDFPTKDITEWVRVNDPDYVPRASSGTQVGERREQWGFSFTVFTKTGGEGAAETNWRAAELCDLIRAAFDWITLPVLDDTPDTVAKLYFERGAMRPQPRRREGDHWISQITMSYEAVLWA